MPSEHHGKLSPKLSPKRRAFVAAYLGAAMHNATEAARIAGYAAPGAEGHRLLKNAEVKKAVETGLARVEQKAAMDRAEALDLLASIARGEIGETKVETDLSGEVTGMHEVPPKPGDRTKALALMAKMQGWEAPRKTLSDSMTRLQEQIRVDPHGAAERLRLMAKQIEEQAAKQLESGE